MRLIQVSLILVALLLTTVPAYAQDPTSGQILPGAATPTPGEASPTPVPQQPVVLNPAVLDGVVYNIDGQVFAQAPVVAALVPEPGERALIAEATTDAEGIFSFDELPPGNYYLAIGDTNVTYRSESEGGNLVVRTFFNSVTSVSIYLNEDGAAQAEEPVVRQLGPPAPTPRPVDQVNPITVALEQSLAVEYAPAEFGVVVEAGGPGILGSLMLIIIIAMTITLIIFTWYVTMRLPTVSRYRGNL